MPITPKKTSTVTIYTGVVLQCDNCYAVFRMPDIDSRKSCPSCGLRIMEDDKENNDADSGV